jgi:hypothetical protein
MKHFIVVYHAREGSSAIVTALRSHPAIAIPIFEQFDRHWMTKRSIDVDIAAVIEQLFAHGTIPHPPFPHKKNAEDRLTRSPPPAIGFKWRPHGNLRRLVSTLRRHRVLVFFLARRDLFELCASLYFTERLSQVKGPNDVMFSHHLQFDRTISGEGESEEGQIKRTVIQTFRPALDRQAFWRLLLRRTAVALRHAAMERVLRACGVETARLYYEDFAADNERFFAGLVERLGLDPAPEPLAPKFTKVIETPARERVAGVAALEREPLAAMLAAVYAAAIGRGGTSGAAPGTAAPAPQRLG